MSNNRQYYQQKSRTKAVALPVSDKPWGRITDAYKRYQWGTINPTLSGFAKEFLEIFIS